MAGSKKRSSVVDGLESMSPVILKSMPIYSDLKIEIAQSNLNDKRKSELLVTFSVGHHSTSVVFSEQEAMTQCLNEVKRLKSIADTHHLDSKNNRSHDWIRTYTKFGCKVDIWYTCINQPTRSNSVPNDSSSALRYVLPLQRAETIAKINLKRTRTITAPKERKIAFEKAKDHWINAQLMKRENDFVQWQRTTAFVGTWNVHGSLPNSSLKTWLQGTLKTKDGQVIEKPDFYIIGLQEMETNTEAYIRYDPTKENAWVKAIIDSLVDNGKDYYKVESKQLVTMLLIVIAKKSHRPFVSEVSSTYAGVGLMNMMGNKGGVAVRFRFHDSYLCFVTSHLAAFTDKTEKRNQDFTELTKRLVFPQSHDPLTHYVFHTWNDGGDEGVSFLETNQVIRDWSMDASIFHNDFLIWCGDLNYRVNLNEAIIKNWLRQGRLDILLAYDQLSIERNAGRTFPMFEEGQITFPPTYKYDAGTNQYDTRKGRGLLTIYSEKRRAPSWTDRVLWKKEREDMSKKAIELIDYDHCMDMMMSDHKPVRALFGLQIRKIDSRQQSQTQKQLVEQLKSNQDVQPRGEISSSFVDFEKVQFMEYKEKTVVLRNTGQVVTVFKFMPKDETTGTILPPWLQVTPLSGVVAPGEQVIIRFEVTVDPTISTPLNCGEAKMEEILILRLENSRDFFISVLGDYVPTCFGVPLERLSDMTVPISEAAASNLNGTRQKKEEEGRKEEDPLMPNQIDLPKELWKIINFLWNSNMFCITSLFLDHGDLMVSTYIRQCLDHGESFDTNMLLGEDPADQTKATEIENQLSDLSLSDRSRKEAISANSMIDVLVAFLECLPEPLIPTDLYERALEASRSEESMNYFEESLTPFRKNVLLYIGMFLRQAIDRAPESVRKEREHKIVDMFTVLLRPPIDFKERNPVVAKEKREKFVQQLLNSLRA
ncbi:Type II inositol 1,4,5-trisphosphate 5-phosphatase [Choanephora cucurbitarum]|uniref:Type II inositol 1,4,5-trisphosphate 5-phosphatase n=1 Tax=Choanephora cucurbitarum TaxID=101091 RepID=A0A1C7N069_9FUNG|nr:Type II inositol 1,4,5-trisphosphate 5-phosphatase [Choanephora cucurbitarum]